MSRRRLQLLLPVLCLLTPIRLAEAKKLGPPPPDAERGAIAVELRGRFPLGQKAPAVQVHFVRLGEDVDMLAAESVVPSNFYEKKQVYLLNARPGRYVAVAAQLRQPFGTAGDYEALFDHAMIPQTEVEVTAGQMTFLGDLLVDLKVKMTGADDAQLHYFRLIAPGAAGKGSFGRALSAEYMYRGELVALDRAAATEAAFWKAARDAVFAKEPVWRALVERQLAAGENR